MSADFPLDRRALLGGGAALLASPQIAAAQTLPRVTIKTGKGDIVVALEARRAPLTVANFLRYVDSRAYDNGRFFRAARIKAAPKFGTIVGAQRTQQPFPPIKHESTARTGLKHLDGTISLGRFAPGTATSNFFICVGDSPSFDADPKRPGDNLGYAAFGRVVSGMGVVKRILASPTGAETQFADQRDEWLKPPIPILSMRRV